MSATAKYWVLIYLNSLLTVWTAVSAIDGQTKYHKTNRNDQIALRTISAALLTNIDCSSVMHFGRN
jgi:hypothetical protein